MAIRGSSAELSGQMRLLLVNYEYPPVGAGAATATQAIAHNLIALGQQVTVLTGSFRGQPARAEEDGLTVLRVRCLRRRADRSSVLEMFSFTLSALWALPTVRASQRPDALIAFFSLPSGPVGAAAHLWYKLPYVVSLRGGDVPGLTPEVSWIHRLLAPFRRSILEHAEAVVANSEGLKKLSEVTDRTPVRVIPNGVDTEFFHPNRLEAGSVRSARKFRILFVGRFQSQKNLPYLLEECSRFTPESFELHLVGDGPLFSLLHDQADQLGISSAITWHGWLPRPALRTVYQSVDCFVNPSLYEGMPNVVLEAMACGLPVVASNIPGNDALVLPGKTGHLFDLHRPGVLFETLAKLRTDPVACSQLGANGRARVVSEFSWRRVAEGYLDLLQQNPVASIS